VYNKSNNRAYTENVEFTKEPDFFELFEINKSMTFCRAYTLFVFMLNYRNKTDGSLRHFVALFPVSFLFGFFSMLCFSVDRTFKTFEYLP